MGLFSSLFGSKKSSSGPELDRGRLLSMTEGNPSQDEDAEKILDLVGREKNFKHRVEAFNILIEEGRKEWAEAYARQVSKLDDTPPFILKALATQHFLAEGKIEEFLDPCRAALKEYPSETDLALAIGRVQLKNGEFQAGLDDLEHPLESAPESRHMFAMIGELYRGMEQHEEAMIHLRTSLELYSEAFKLQTIVTSDLQVEEFEFTRLYGLLEEEAAAHFGLEKASEAFENIKYTPADIGVRREGDRMANMRVEYKPGRMEIPSLSEMEKQAEELPADKSERYLYAGSVALRTGEYEEAIDEFRRALEFDLESHGAYFGWAAAGDLQRNMSLKSDMLSSLTDEERAYVSGLFPGWDNLTAHEKNLANACALPVRLLLGKIVKAQSRICIHPLDVRLKDLFPDPKAMEFEHSQKTPPAADAFTADGNAHLRLDAFLLTTAGRLPLAWHLGMLAWQVISQDASQKKKVEDVFRAEKGASKIARNAGSFFATAVEVAVIRECFGDCVIEVQPDLSNMIG